MFESYNRIAEQYQNLPLEEERNLIKLAQKGKRTARNKLLLHQMGFLLFKVNTKLVTSVLKQSGEDILQNCAILSLKKIYTYNLRYRNKKGKLQPVYFRTYIWKSTDGLIIDSVKSGNKKEICFSDLSETKLKRYNKYA